MKRMRQVVLTAVAVFVISGSPSAQTPVGPPDPLAAARADLTRARAQLGRGDAIGSRPILELVARAAAKAGDQLLLQRALNSLSDVQADLNDYPAMLDFAQRAYDALPDPKGRARIVLLTYRGRALQEMRDRDGAVAAYAEAIELARAAGADSNLGGLFNEMGLLTWRLERDHDRALAYYEEGLAIFRRLKELRNQRVILNNSGNLFRRPGAYAEAERRYSEGIKLARAEGGDDAMLLKNMGIVLRETGRRAEAEQTLLKAVSLADSGGIGRIRWQGRMELGNFYRDLDPGRAAEYFEGALDVLEAQFNNVLLEGFRAGALSGAITIYDDPYELYLDLLLKNGRERDAFFVSERARARAFLDTLSSARDQLAAALPPPFVAEERTILDRISAHQAALRTTTLTAEKRREIGAEVDAEEERLNAMRLRLAADYPALAHARYPHLFSLDEVQQKLLAPNDALLQYFIGAEAGTLWVVTKERVEVRRLPPRSEIEASVRELLGALATPTGDYKSAAKALAGKVLPDLKNLVGGAARLIVIPHGVLNYVPFEALLMPDDRFLVEGHLVSYAPSASSLAFLRGRAANGTELLAIGNPVMRGGGPAAERGRAADRPDLLKPLPYSSAEVRSLSTVFGSTARVLEQQDATEAALDDSRLARAGIIHFATHGLIDEDRPDRSGLALTAAPPSSDGILQVREVFRLHLNAALVTLSACESALGKEVTGEGIVGLSRAFFYAGANAVLASLWNVNDASTAQLMTPLYGALAAGRPLDEAIQTAKVSMIRSGGRLSHPYYWAAFVMTGDASATVPVRPGWRFSWLWLGGALAGCAAIGLAWRRVR